MLDFFDESDAQDPKAFNQVETDENFYQSSADQFIQGVLTLMTGLTIFKVTPSMQSKENGTRPSE